MADFSLSGGGAYSLEDGFDSSNVRGTAITANASANTKGAWVSILTAGNNTFYSQEVTIYITGIGGNVDARHLIDVGVGAAASEQVIIPNLYVNTSASSGGDSIFTFRFPIGIPAGVAISVRSQASSGGAVSYVHVARMPKGTTSTTPLSKVTAYGADTGSTAGVTITRSTAGTFGTWQQLVASTGDQIRGFCVGTMRDAVSWSSGRGAYEVGVGGSTPETVLSTQVWTTNASEAGCGFTSPYFPINIKSGSEIRIRAVATANNADFDNDFVLYGVN